MPQILLLKAATSGSKVKIANAPGMVLVNHRWHKVSPEEKAQHDPKLMLQTQYELQAHKKHANDPEITKLAPEEQVAALKGKASEIQKQATTAAQGSVWKKKIFSGKQPSTSEWKAFLGMPKDKRDELMKQVRANPEALALFQEGAAKFKADAVENIARGGSNGLSGVVEGDQAQPVGEGKPAESEAVQAGPEPEKAQAAGKVESRVADEKDSTVPPGADTGHKQRPTSGKPDSTGPADTRLGVAGKPEDTKGGSEKTPEKKPVGKGKSPFAGKKVPEKYTLADVRAALVAAHLPDTHANAKWFNGQLDTIIGKLDSGDHEGLGAMKFGSNSYAQWLDKMRNLTVGAMKSAGQQEKPAEAKPAEEAGPKDGDTKQGADGTLVFKDGRWHKQGGDKPAEKAATKPEATQAKTKKQLVEDFEKLGAQAAKDGKPSTPAKNPDVQAALKGVPLKWGADAMKGYLKGWNKGFAEANSGSELPDGWDQSSEGSIATNLDPESGGLISVTPATGKWALYPNNKAIKPIEDLPSKQAAFDALAQALADLKSTPKNAAEMTKEEFEAAINEGDGKKFAGTYTVDWGNGKGQGKKIGSGKGKMIVGAMSAAPKGNKVYNDILANAPITEEQKKEANLLPEDFQKLQYAKVLSAGFDHHTAMVAAWGAGDKSLDVHKLLIQHAIEKGKRVPKSVLDQYPDLKQNEKPAGWKEQFIDAVKTGGVIPMDSLQELSKLSAADKVAFIKEASDKGGGPAKLQAALETSQAAHTKAKAHEAPQAPKEKKPPEPVPEYKAGDKLAMPSHVKHLPPGTVLKIKYNDKERLALIGSTTIRFQKEKGSGWYKTPLSDSARIAFMSPGGSLGSKTSDNKLFSGYATDPYEIVSLGHVGWMPDAQKKMVSDLMKIKAQKGQSPSAWNFKDPSLGKQVLVGDTSDPFKFVWVDDDGNWAAGFTNKQSEAIASGALTKIQIDDGPKEGDTKQGAGGMLVFKNGRWHLMDGSGDTFTPFSKDELPEFDVVKMGGSAASEKHWFKAGPQQFWANGHIMLFSGKPPQGAEDHIPMWQEDSLKDSQTPGKYLAAAEKMDVEVHPKIIATQSDSPTVYFASGKGNVVAVDAHYAAWLMDQHPNATFKTEKEPGYSSVLGVFEDGKPVALVMPYKTSDENQENAKAVMSDQPAVPAVEKPAEKPVEAPKDDPVAKAKASAIDAVKKGADIPADDIKVISHLDGESYNAVVDEVAAAYAEAHGMVGRDAMGIAFNVALKKIAGADLDLDDTMTVNGTTYKLRKGNWVKQEPEKDTEPKVLSKDDLKSLKDVDAYDISNSIEIGKFTAEQDKAFDVLGKTGKAKVYAYAAAYTAFPSTINKCAAMAAVFGKPGYVLTAASGEWIPATEAAKHATLVNTAPASIKWQALDSIEDSIVDQPTSGPSNPNVTQTFGQGTVEFHGPMKIHDILSGKGWSVSAGPSFKLWFQAGKAFKDWSVSPSGKLPTDQWNQAKFFLHDLLPDGAVVEIDGKKMKIEHHNNGVLHFLDEDGGLAMKYTGKKEDVNSMLTSLWTQNATIIPPGHPEGNKPTEKPSENVADQGDAQYVNGDAVGFPGAYYKKVGGQWVVFNSLEYMKGGHGTPVAPTASFLGKLDQIVADSPHITSPLAFQYIALAGAGKEFPPDLISNLYVKSGLSVKEKSEIEDAAVKAYADNHGIDMTDSNGKDLAQECVFDLGMNKGPKEGDTKVINGVTYQLINGRWHKVSPDEKPAGKEKAADVHPIDALEMPDLSTSKNPTLVKDALEELKEKAKTEGVAAFKGVLKAGTKHGYKKTIITLKSSQGNWKVHVYDDNVYNKPFFQPLKQYIEDMKQAVTISGAKKKKSATTKPAQASAGAQPEANQPYTPPPKPATTLNVGKTVQVGNAKARVIDGWKKVGDQQGSNNGGTYDDGTGQKWYCKFPSDPDVVKNEILSTKFYEMMGLSVPSFRLVVMNGKLGTASKIIDGLQKKSLSDLAKAPGAQEGFYVDAWLANWDVVGLGNDNLMVDKDGKAVRVDAGGSLVYRAMGGKKGAAFGDDVTELNTLLDAGMNPKTAELFANADPAKLEYGLDKIAKITPAQIKKMCEMFGPGTEADQAALADKLIARRAFILKAAGKADPWEQAEPDKTKLKVAPADLPEPINFSNYKDTGKPLSSKPHINEQNTKDDQALLDFAKKGNLQALLDYHYDAVDKETGAPLGKKPISEHPSKDIKNHWSDLCDLLTSVAYPPIEGLDLPPLESSTAEEVNQEVGYFQPGIHLANAPKESVLGFWLKLGHVGAEAVAGLMPEKQSYWHSSLTPGVKEWFNGISSLTKSLISAIQGSGEHNHMWSTGQTKWGGTPLQKLATQVYADAVSHEEGTTIHRWMKMTAEMRNALLKEGPGLVFQNNDSMCCSVYKNWGDQAHFGSGAFLKIRYAKGAKALDTYGSGGFFNETKDEDGYYEKKGDGEMEVTTLMGQRFVVLDVKKGNASDPNGITLDLLMLPPHEGFVAEMQKLAAMGKCFSMTEIDWVGVAA